MNRRDFLKITGTDRQSAQYLPIAFLLRAGYGCAGYYNSDLNQGIEEMCVLLNARIISLGNRSTNREQSAIGDFNEFLQEIVVQLSRPGSEEDAGLLDSFGKSIPLTAVPFNEISVLYPVAQIGRLMQMIRRPQVVTEPSEADLKLDMPAGASRAASGKRPPIPKRPAVAEAPTAKTAAGQSRPTAIKSGPKPPGDIPTFLDFNNKSVVLQVLRTKLW